MDISRRKAITFPSVSFIFFSAQKGGKIAEADTGKKAAGTAIHDKKWREAPSFLSKSPRPGKKSLRLRLLIQGPTKDLFPRSEGGGPK